jgi:NADH-quinone oxidoreductase subunit N
MAVGVKAAAFAAFARVLSVAFGSMTGSWSAVLWLIAALTMTVGNVTAVSQLSVKRMLAYSSIAHAGYLLIGVVSLSGTAVAYYLVAYLLMTLLAFAVLVVVAQQAGERIQDFAGLGKRSPFLAFAMLIAMVSLAGVPFTAGFFGKFLIFNAAIEHHQTALIVVGVITVACGFYYYLKVIRAMYWEDATSAEPISITGLSRTAMTFLMIAIVWLGVYPQPILNALNR